MIIICGHMPGQWKNDEMIYVVPGQNIPKKDDVINVQSLIYMMATKLLGFIFKRGNFLIFEMKEKLLTFQKL